MGRIANALRRMGGSGDENREPKKGSKVEGNKVSPEHRRLDFPKILFGEVSPLVFSYYGVFPTGIEEMKHACSTLLNLPDAVLMFTSAQPSEGKTLIAINLAITLAKYFSKRVLYIDSDMRAPHSSLSYLDLPERRLVGFSDVLGGDSEPFSAIVSTEVEGLFLMPRGKKVELDKVPPQKIKEVLGTVSPVFDFVFVDSSPVRIFSDARLLAGLVSAVVVVVRMNSTPRGSVKHAVQLLKDSKARKIYFILNGVRNYMPGSKPKGYYYY